MTEALGYADATLNITTDIVFAVLIPVPLFWQLNIKTRRRIYLMMVLGLGILACSACIIKTIHLYQMADYEDFLWDSQYITIWVVAELNTGIVAGSIPATRPCVRALVGRTPCRKDKQNKITPFSLTTIGSHRRSWRILPSAQRSSLVASSGVSSGDSELPSNLEVVVEDGHLYELVETGIGDDSERTRGR